MVRTVIRTRVAQNSIGVSQTELAVVLTPRYRCRPCRQVWRHDLQAAAPARGKLSRTDVCHGIQGVTEAAGIVWVACTSDDAVVALDSEDLSELTRIPLEEADAITSDEKRVIAVGQVGPTIVEIDPATRHEQKRTALSNANAVRDTNADTRHQVLLCRKQKPATPKGLRVSLWRVRADVSDASRGAGGVDVFVGH